jgi:hypothetical protein
MEPSMYERILREVREIGFVTLFFLTCFSGFLGFKKLILEEYDIKATGFGTAVVGALVVAKVVVLLEKTSFGHRFRSGPLLLHVFWRSLAYSAAVFVVTLAEHLFDFYRKAGGMDAALSDLWKSMSFQHFLAMNLCVGISFLIYNTFAEIDRHLGSGGLRRLLLSPRSEADSSGASRPAPAD